MGLRMTLEQYLKRYGKKELADFAEYRGIADISEIAYVIVKDTPWGAPYGDILFVEKVDGKSVFGRW